MTDTESDRASAREAHLVRRAVSGQADAFGDLYDVYADRVFRFVLARIGDRQTAEDLTSKVFLSAWEKIGAFELRGSWSFSAWLFRIARNAVVDHYRVHKETASLSEVIDVQADEDADVVAEVAGRLQAERLHSLMAHLTEEQQQVLALKFLSGLSTREVARIMDKRPGAIRALQMRGLQALAELMASEDD